MSALPIGILGASGQVGRYVVRWLSENHDGPLRLGARDPALLDRLPCRSFDQVQTVDLFEDAQLEAFCAGTRLIVNCAGPSYQVLDRVARCAAESGCDYVDVSGDGPAYHALKRNRPGSDDRIFLLSAGMLPGLANLVPACFTDFLGGSLCVYSGGVETLSGAAAADLVLSLWPPDNGLSGMSWGEANASWELGQRRLRSLAAKDNVSIDFFPGHVSLLPFLSPDAERLALRWDLKSLRWFNVFCGERLRDALISLRARQVPLQDAVQDVEKAGKVDLVGRTPYYALVFEFSRPDRTMQRAIVRTSSSLALTAAVAVIASLEIVKGKIPAGLHFADEILAPEATLNGIQRLHPQTRIWFQEFGAFEDVEGIL